MAEVPASLKHVFLKHDWRGYNGGQATKDDLLNVCEVLESVLRGTKVVYKASHFRVPELRKRMDFLLARVGKRLGMPLACPACKGTGRQPLHSEGTMTKCLPCGGSGEMYAPEDK
jgi:hypothetical protein